MILKRGSVAIKRIKKKKKTTTVCKTITLIKAKETEEDERDIGRGLWRTG